MDPRQSGVREVRAREQVSQGRAESGGQNMGSQGSQGRAESGS